MWDPVGPLTGSAVAVAPNTKKVCRQPEGNGDVSMLFLGGEAGGRRLSTTSWRILCRRGKREKGVAITIAADEL